MENEEIKKLNKALDYAIQIIESYQMDIRNSAQFVDGGETLSDIGFCQGSIYLNSIKDIKKIAGRDK